MNVFPYICISLTSVPKPVFPNLPSVEERLNNFPYPEEPLPMYTYTAQKKKTKKMQVVGHGDLFQYCQLPEKFPAIFRRIVKIFRRIEVLRIYSAISHGSLFEKH